jgi:hypothetical protein
MQIYWYEKEGKAVIEREITRIKTANGDTCDWNKFWEINGTKRSRKRSSKM